MSEKQNQDHIFYRSSNKYYPTLDRGEGVYIYDTEGKRYLDGSGGAAVVLIGHGIKEIRRAMLEQAKRFLLRIGLISPARAGNEAG